MSEIKKWYVKQHGKGNGNVARTRATCKLTSRNLSSIQPDKSMGNEIAAKRRNISVKRKTEKGGQDAHDIVEPSCVKKVHKVEDEANTDKSTPNSVKKKRSNSTPSKILKGSSGRSIGQDDVDTEFDEVDVAKQTDSPANSGGKGCGQRASSTPATNGRGRESRGHGEITNLGKRKDSSQKAEKELPEGTPDCLGGLTFVISGTLDSLERDEAEDMIKRHGGHVTGSVSKKTDYLLCNEDIGGQKSAKAKELGTPFLTDYGLFDMIRASKRSKTRAQGKSKKPSYSIPTSAVRKIQQNVQPDGTSAKELMENPSLDLHPLSTIRPQNHAPLNLKGKRKKRRALKDSKWLRIAAQKETKRALRCTTSDAEVNEEEEVPLIRFRRRGSSNTQQRQLVGSIASPGTSTISPSTDTPMDSDDVLISSLLKTCPSASAGGSIQTQPKKVVDVHPAPEGADSLKQVETDPKKSPEVISIEEVGRHCSSMIIESRAIGVKETLIASPKERAIDVEAMHIFSDSQDSEGSTEVPAETECFEAPGYQFSEDPSKILMTTEPSSDAPFIDSTSDEHIVQSIPLIYEIHSSTPAKELAIVLYQPSSQTQDHLIKEESLGGTSNSISVSSKTTSDLEVSKNLMPEVPSKHVILVEDLDDLLEGLRGDSSSKLQSRSSKDQILSVAARLKYDPSNLELMKECSGLLREIYPLMAGHCRPALKSLERAIIEAQQQFISWSLKESVLKIDSSEVVSITSHLAHAKEKVVCCSSLREKLQTQIADIDKEIAKLVGLRSKAEEQLKDVNHELNYLSSTLSPIVEVARVRIDRLKAFREAEESKIRAKHSIEALLDGLSSVLETV